MTAALGDLLLELHAAHGCGQLRLGPLDALRLDRVIAGRFDEAVAGAIGTLVLAISGGHPGIVAAALHHLDGGAGMNLRVSYWCTADRAALMTALQDGARDAILWRLANLDRGDRMLLETAAVIGMSFTAADVALALDGARPFVRESLDRLADWGLLLSADTSQVAAEFVHRSAGEGGPVYRFWHPFQAELLARGAGGFEMLRAAANLSRGRNGQWEIA